MKAVITADIVNSSQLDKASERLLLNILKKVLMPYKYEFYRGDSFQVYVEDAAASFALVLKLRSSARQFRQPITYFDIKASIGIGEVMKPVRDISQAKGEAFLLSGRSFDERIVNDRRLTINCGKEPFDTAFSIISSFTDYLFEQLTSGQAIILSELLSGHTQQAIAKRMKKSQPTISGQARASGYPQLKELLSNFDYLIKTIPS